MNLFNLIAKIGIDDKEFNKGIEGAEKKGSKLSSALGGVGKGIATMSTAVVGAVSATSVAVGGLVAKSVQQYASYEQLVGGVETLFKDSAPAIVEYASNAYKTAGMSANEYMETITGFSASLIQSLGGDTEKAGKVGNMAIEDMSDNANKMGTSMEMIQNAYQGFAKQNYTMLDNLKLGYGGTQAEMQRLLSDAEKISGVHYDMSKFSDVVEAIHVIQTQMGITGTTMKEGATTIEGSLNMMKASWTNVLTGMADDSADFDKLIDNFVESASAFGDNILPRIEIALQGVGKLIEAFAEKVPTIVNALLPQLLETSVNIIQSLTSSIIANLPTLTTTFREILGTMIEGIRLILPQMIELGIQLLGNLATGIRYEAPNILPIAIECVAGMVNAFISGVPMLIESGIDLISGLGEGIINAIPTLTGVLPIVLDGIISFFTTNLPQLLQQGANVILSLVNGIVEELPTLVGALPQIIDTIVNFLLNSLPQIIERGIEIITALVDGLVQALPQIIAMLPEIINTITTGLLAHLPELISVGIQLIVAIANGLLQAIPQIVGQVPAIVGAIKSGFASVSWGDVGSNIIRGIATGITSGIKGLVSVGIQACKSLKDSVLGFFDIHSPSRVMRDEVGKNIALGIARGIEAETKTTVSSMAKLSVQAYNMALSKANTYKEVGAGYITNIKAGIENNNNLLIETVKSSVEKSVKAFTDANGDKEGEYKKAGEKLITAYTDALKTGTSDAMDKIQQSIGDMTETFQTAYDNIIKNRDALRDKMADYGDLFKVDEDGDLHIANINKQTNAIKEYANLLTQLKDKGVSSEFLLQVSSYSIEEGTEFMQKLLNKSDENFSKYVNAWEEKQKLATELSQKFYEGQLNTLDADFVNKINGAMTNVPSIMNNVGIQAMNGFIGGMDSKMSEIVKKSNDIAKNVVDSFKEAFDIHSPSRVMKKIGVFIGDGLKNGMHSSLDGIQKESERMQELATISASDNSDIISDSLGKTTQINSELNNSLNAENNRLISSLISALKSQNNNDIVLNINGREFARATGKDINTELNRISKNNARGLGLAW